MKLLISSLAALALSSVAPSIASAADLGYDYAPRHRYVEDRPPPPPPRYEVYPVPPPVFYRERRFPRPYPYFAFDPYWGPRWHREYRPYWAARYWGPRYRW